MLLFCIGLFSFTSISQNKKVTVGDFAYGGIVFYVDESGEHGLVCSKVDVGENVKWVERKVIRKNNRLSNNMTTNKSLFGSKNKVKQDFFASQLCENFEVTEEGKKYNDWYLPTKEELNLMYLQKEKINETSLANQGKAFGKTYYWASTEEDFTRAWTQYFYNGKQIDTYKKYKHNVRAIRAF